MAEEICCFNKDTLIPKPPKKSPFLSRMVILVFAVVFGVYIYTICLKRISTHSKTKFLNVQVIEKPCRENDIDLSEIPYMHYPKPETFHRAECEGNPVQFFAILSMQRSGSGWFETLLNSHVNVSSNGEIFSVKARRKNISSIVQTLDKVYNLDWFSSASKNQCSAAVGFKWMFNQYPRMFYGLAYTIENPAVDGVLEQGLMEHHKEIAEYFNRKGVSAIFLLRRNLLRRMVSVLANSYDRYAKLLNGTHKSHVHTHEEAHILSKYKPFINSTALIADLNDMKATRAKVLKYFNHTRHIILYYEDLIMNRIKLEDVQDFLKLPHMKLTSRQIKIHKGPLSDHIKNWEEINKTLTGTAYESFLHSEY